MGRIEVKTSPVTLAEPLEQVDRVFVQVDGRKLIYFGGCDYYRLASNPNILRAAARRLTRVPLNVAASRVTTGNHWAYEQLEAALRIDPNFPGAQELLNEAKTRNGAGTAGHQP